MAENGDAHAQESVAVFYREGKQGLPQNDIEAYKWAYIANAKYLLREFDFFISEENRTAGKKLAQEFLAARKTNIK